ncbi:MAG: hypothetical protein K2Q06_00600 [Parvularculaceae bacterium]|nr:hypothetical protein [Parvularculaceae bacterium]
MILPGDIEIDLYRISNGEPVKWQGMSSGAVEKLQGYVVMAAAGVMALFVLPEALIALKILSDFNGPALVESFAGLMPLAGLAGAAVVFFIGWRHVQTSGRIAWAVTSKRLIRMIGGEADKARSWHAKDVVKVARTTWGSAKTEALLVTVKGRSASRRRNQIHYIVGPTDLDVAERALKELEP